MRGLMGRIADFFRESDKLMLILCLMATTYGCVAVFSSTYYMESFRPIIVQSFCLVLGFLAALFISSYDYENIFKNFNSIFISWG